ncbi:MAG: 1-(5-phosphoribosyl)-5-[(5-phosphoribosylamino)methylideneamino]imidazole-4-carboxamide isomerase [Nitrososphaerota archaeon]|nr:1-(5-phosphoribosyl)-5-[(5-phosphoribosylamino)methylideneamino]imidazole-4-carboxamide isomerase [Candidatus Bathyarchaeota archaeon]MDW8022313.1 1-(5-phosphoribosyl)-5-[(5-phosphoribosylamino)methylideneamino]imidazole-4-carboxamide isomerase [Nitrososphaerota archaeon]
MKVFPAIDLMEGKVVRLCQGDPKTAKKYDYLGEPVTMAKKWEREGADALHIIDLDAAFNKGNNLVTISNIVDAVKLPVHVGGGIRSIETAENLLNIGVKYIMLGTLAFKKPEVIVDLVERFGDRIIIALDHRDTKIMVEGWKTSVEIEVKDALKRFLELQVKTFLLTSVSRDGTLGGVDVDVLSQACAYKEARIIAAGGVGSLKDLAVLKRIGVYGVVIGKALYEGLFTLKEALKVAREDG